MLETFKIKTKEKLGLHVDVYHPEDNPRAVLLVLHGMAEHKKRYEELGDFLADRGILVYIYDQRGCGKSQVSGLPKGMIAYQNGWDLLEDDVHQMLGLIHARHENLPIFLLGHSMGSLLARTTAIGKGKDLAGMIMSGTPENPGLMGVLGKGAAVMINSFTDKKKPSLFLSDMVNKGNNDRFEPVRTEFDWLSRDEERVDGYVADEYCGFVCPPSFYLELVKGAQKAWRPETFKRTFKDLPLLLLSGAADPVGGYGQGPEAARAAYLEAGVKRVDLQIYKGGRHEMFNETNRLEVYANLETWLDEAIIGWEG